MRSHFVVFAVLAALAVPVIGSAASARPGPYVSGFLGINVNQDASVSSTDFVTNRSFNDQVEFDPSIDIGGTLGYDFGTIRLEGELTYKQAGIRSVTSRTGGSGFSNVDGDLGAFAMLFNGFFDLHNHSRFTPYLGGGIGFATLHLSDTTGIDSSGRNVLVYGAGSDTVFAYQVGTGVEIAINRQFSLDVGYRYFATDSARIDSDQAITTRLRFESHNAALGFRFRF